MVIKQNNFLKSLQIAFMHAVVLIKHCKTTAANFLADFEKYQMCMFAMVTTNTII